MGEDFGGCSAAKQFQCVDSFYFGLLTLCWKWSSERYQSQPQMPHEKQQTSGVASCKPCFSQQERFTGGGGGGGGCVGGLR